MRIELTIKNYRCFPDSKPARIVLQKGFTGLLGINNSGKSSLLRLLYEFRNLFQRVTENSLRSLCEALRGSPQVFSPSSAISDLEEMFCNANQRDMELRVRVEPGPEAAARTDPPHPKEIVLTVPRATNTWLAMLVTSDGVQGIKDPTITEQPAEGGNHPILMDGQSPVADLSRYVEAFGLLASTLYIGAFRNAINVGSMPNYFDIDIGQAFITRWRGLQTGSRRRDNEATDHLTEDIRHIFGFKELQINPAENDQTLQLFINGKSYRLTELGSGLAQFVLVLANASTKRAAYILIDEPELSLHPSLQIDFLTTLGSYAQQGVVFATHSYGLARATADQVYCLRQDRDGVSDITLLEATPRLPELVGELSYSGYSELGFRKILLVEGATEVKTFHQFLRQRKKDHQVVLLPLGGSQLIRKDSEVELQEVKRICNDVRAVIDSERAAAGAALEPDRQAFKETCDRLSIPCLVLERRATENYLTDAAIKHVKGEKYRALGPYEELKKVPLGWAKSENWRIAREMNRPDVKHTDLGDFLDSI